MPAIDEDTLRDLLHRATNDLHASPAIAAGIVTDSRRRRRRARALSLGATGAAAATALGVVVAVSGAAPRPTMPAITLTAAQRTLTHLSAIAAAASQPAGRYVVMSELQGSDKRTSVIDSKTGDTWTYQSGPGLPGVLPVARDAVPDQAKLDAYPTTVPALRALLIRQAKYETALGLRFELAAVAKKDPKHFRQIERAMRAGMPKETRNDMVFSQAAYLLWNPVVSPALRSALFKVLAATPGVVVNSSARDSIGRSAVEISRYDAAANYTEAIYESPDASAVFETNSIHPATSAHDGLPAEASYSLNDTYLSVTRTNTRPTTSPYGH